jgi:hypothetical protein
MEASYRVARTAGGYVMRKIRVPLLKKYNGNISDPSPKGERSEAKLFGAVVLMMYSENMAISMII